MSDEYAKQIYHHKLNQGGLDDIVKNRRLLSTQARMNVGGAESVRAYVGPVEQEGIATGHTTIEFTTDEKPRKRPSMGGDMAEWRIPDGEHLPIRVERVHMPDGKIIDYAAARDNAKAESKLLAEAREGRDAAMERGALTGDSKEQTPVSLAKSKERERGE